jgi:hypothetical protein
METLSTTIELNAIETNDTAELQALTELNAHDLALVGGGAATVIFE